MSGSVRSRRGCSCDTVCGELDWLTNKKLMAPSNLSFDRINAPSLRLIRRLDQLVDLMLCQVLTRAGGSDCYIYYSRSTLLDVRISHKISPLVRSKNLASPKLERDSVEPTGPAPRIARQHDLRQWRCIAIKSGASARRAPPAEVAA